MAGVQHIYLSPHYDDAALSCGGAIVRHDLAGEAALVATIFGGKPDYARLSPFAHSIHARPSAGADPIDVRVAEEQEALTILGAQSQTYAYLDCIYRQDALRNRWLYDSEEAIFGSIDSADEVLVDELARVLMVLAPAPKSCRIYAPLALGNHVDHQVTHRSARHLHDAGYTVWFYEDYPYVVRDPDGLERMLGQWNERQRWHPEIVELDNTDLTRKIAAIYAYRSQLGVLFGAADVRSALLSFGQQIASAWGKGGYAERFWCLQR